MLKSILERLPLSKEEEKAVFKQFVEKNLHPNEQLLQQIHQHKQQVCDLFARNPDLSINLLFDYLSIEECFEYLEPSTKVNQSQDDNSLGTLPYILRRVFQSLSHTNENTQEMTLFCKQYARHSGIEKTLVIVSIFAEFLVGKLSPSQLPVFVADFIRASAITIESYMKLKAQAPKFDVDYIEHGSRLVKCTEEWVTQAYVKMLQNLSKVNFANHQNSDKKAVENGVMDIIGALLEIQRQGNIEEKHCSRILNSCFQYFSKTSNLSEIYTSYTRRLRQQNFYTKPEKLQIPQGYKHTDRMNRSGFAFLVLKFLEKSNSKSGRSSVYNHSYAIQCLISAYNEIVIFEFDIKEKIFAMMCDLLEGINEVSLKNDILAGTHLSGHQRIHLPFIIFLFNLWLDCEKKTPNAPQKDSKVHLDHYKKIWNYFLGEVSGDQSEKNFDVKRLQMALLVDSLNILAMKLHVENQENFVNQFIGIVLGQCLDRGILTGDQKSTDTKTDIERVSKRILVLIGNVNWRELNSKGETIWTEIIKKLYDSSSYNAKILKKQLDGRCKGSKFYEVVNTSLFENHKSE